MHVRPATPEGVVATVAARIAERSGRVRVVIDGALAAHPHELADQVSAALAPRPALHVRADHFLRAQSLRFEHGRTDPDMWLDHWLDEGALLREVLTPCVTTGVVLPALRDPVTDRSVRAAAVTLPDDGVVIVSGAALLGRGLPFEVTVHLQLSPQALMRRTPADQAWTLAGLARYELEREPWTVADVVVRCDDPRHPALVIAPGDPG